MKDKRIANFEKLTTGEMCFSSDITPGNDYLYVYPVVSNVPSGKLLSIDFSEAERVEGFIYGYTAKDIPGKNAIGAISREEEPLLAFDTLNYVGQPVAIVIANSYESAKKAARLTRLEIEEYDDPVLTIDDAIKKNSFYGVRMSVSDGDVQQGLENSQNVISGNFETGAQEHAYIETQRAFAQYSPFNKNVLIYSGTQAITDVQQVVALLLGINETSVEVDVYRVGGAFGGKERGGTMWAAMSALGLAKTGRKCALILDRSDDLKWTGKRHPYFADYKVGFDDDGKITALECNIYANGGYYEDFTEAIMERSVLCLNGCYHIKDIKITGSCCKTNYPANTAFRGFGAPQATLIMEEIIYRVSNATGIAVEEVQKRNFYKEGELAPFGMPMVDVIVPDIHKDILATASYLAALDDIKSFNSSHQYRKRGIGIVPIKYGIGFTSTFLNQGNALVYVYTDGSVSVSHGGIEMGQGLFTKIELIVAKTLGIKAEHVTCQSSNSLRAGSVSSTAASTGTDLNGAAAKMAAEDIKKTMTKAASHFMQENYNLETNLDLIKFEDDWVWDIRLPEKKISFASLASFCYFHRYNMGAQAHYATPGMKYDMRTGKGIPFAYFTNGVAFAVAEIDVLTGDCLIRKVHIKHEGGNCLNYEIDYGQVLGGFMQGLGYVTMEDFPYDKGKAMATSFSTYKIPLISDLPEDLTIEIVPTDTAISGVLGSKGVGEPPLLYGAAVFSAVRNAIENAKGDGKPVFLKMPATNMHIVEALRSSF